jgi:SAM-dependent methyltransferase
MRIDDGFTESQDGCFLPNVPVRHRDSEYDPAGFDALGEMQSRHFWYRGRHRFLLSAVRRVLGTRPQEQSRSAIDLGAGCGGWVAYLQQRRPHWFSELALADSSISALEYAGTVVGSEIRRFQVDLLRLPWQDRWDVAFLLDVLEHIPNDIEAMKQIHNSLRPGGYLFVTTPALRFFWTYNDRLAHHVRRYSRRDLARLANASQFELCWSRYFMFILSPLLLLSRLHAPDLQNMSPDDIRAHLRRTHQVPSSPLNSALGLVFCSEAPLGVWLPFPWGTSVLGVFRKIA